MSNTVDEVTGRNSSKIDFARRIAPGIIEVDIERVMARRAARGADAEHDFKCSGVVKADFVPNQEMYKHGLYDD